MSDSEPLEAAAVDELWQQYAEGRAGEDRNRLVVHYAPLVKYVAGRFAGTLPPHVDIGDLYSEGMIGLLGAVERFDPGRSVDFAGFAVGRIRGAMVDGLRVLDWLPRTARAQVRDLEISTQRLYAELQRTPTAEEVALRLGLDPVEVGARQRQLAQSRPVPLVVEDVDAVLTQAAVDQGGETQLPRTLVRALRSLPERDQVLVALYYYERLTMAEIGQVLGVSESRVSQLHQQLRQEIRRRVSSMGCSAGRPTARGPRGRRDEEPHGSRR